MLNCKSMNAQLKIKRISNFIHWEKKFEFHRWDVSFLKINSNFGCWKTQTFRTHILIIQSKLTTPSYCCLSYDSCNYMGSL